MTDVKNDKLKSGNVEQEIERWLVDNFFSKIFGSEKPFPFDNGRDWIIWTYIILISVLAIGIFYFNKRKKQRLLDRDNNKSGVSIFSLRIYNLISFLMICCVIQNCLHLVMIYVSRAIDTNPDLEDDFLFCMCVIITLIEQARTGISLLINANIVFEIITLLMVVVREIDMTVPELLYHA